MHFGQGALCCTCYKTIHFGGASVSRKLHSRNCIWENWIVSLPSCAVLAMAAVMIGFGSPQPGLAQTKVPTQAIDAFGQEVTLAPKTIVYVAGSGGQRPCGQDAGQTARPEAGLHDGGTEIQVFPLDDRTIPRFFGVKPSYDFGKTSFNYPGEVTNVPFPGVTGARISWTALTQSPHTSRYRKAAPRECSSPTAAAWRIRLLRRKGRPGFHVESFATCPNKVAGQRSVKTGATSSSSSTGSMTVPDLARVAPER